MDEPKKLNRIKVVLVERMYGPWFATKLGKVL